MAEGGVAVRAGVRLDALVDVDVVPEDLGGDEAPPTDLALVGQVPV